jgi:hypothetical protein
MKKSNLTFMLLFSFMFLISLLLISASSEYVSFNGSWANGTALYSQAYPLGNYTLYSKDIYPNMNTVLVQTICKNNTINYTEPVCILTTIHYTRLIKVRHGNNVTYENITSSRITRECHLESKTKIVKSCNAVRTKIGCTNPITGVYTNQLSLQSYKYSLDGNIWNIVPYNKLVITNSQVKFKLDIPAVCSPEYYINRSILITN